MGGSVGTGLSRRSGRKGAAARAYSCRVKERRDVGSANGGRANREGHCDAEWRHMACAVAVDNPHAPRPTLHILAAVAEHGREMIARRTKAALQAAKARGIRLGSNGADRLAPAYRAEAVERARQLAPIFAELKRVGMSARQMAAELTVRGIATPNGGTWHAQTILRMIDRAGC